MASPRYLIGGGEKLSEEVTRPPRGFGDKAHPYTFNEAVQRLAPQLAEVRSGLAALTELACPGGDTVVGVTLHPTYLAKSYYPSNLIDELKLQHLGSRAVHITPSKVVTNKSANDPRPQPAPLIYLGGRRERLLRFAELLPDWRPVEQKVRAEFREIEKISLPEPERAKPLPDTDPEKLLPLEIVLHAKAGDGEYVVEGFDRFVRSLGLSVDVDRRRQSSGLCFLPMYAPKAAVPQILNFSFLRALRSMPRIIPLDPAVRSLVPGFKVTLPTEAASAPELKVAILDGGLPANHGLEKWVTRKKAPGVGNAISAAQSHGLAVTSAFLFGPLNTKGPQPIPPADVDHWRILGDDTASDDFELFSVLDRIEYVLDSRPYDFVNISLGPDCAIEDDDVNAWTSTLDALLADGETVATVACGNNGESDVTLGLHRIQPPSDGVNMIAVGASDCMDPEWQRAPYSAWGPGRSPGYVKPDLVSFGGTPSSPFLVLTGPSDGTGTQGTSFAAPLALRSGALMRAQFDDPLWAPTIKGLLVHHAHPGKNSRAEVGWGRVSHSLLDLVTCQDGEAHIVYQRQMPVSGAVRLYLPVPPNLSGNVEIRATFCFFCDVDPEDTINYTRGGLEIQFRPDTHKLAPPYYKDGKLITPKLPPTDTFFGSDDFYAPEFMRRDDAQKWETTLTRSKTKRASSLNDPAFDVSHITRSHGATSGRRPAIKFALVLTLKNKAPDLYDRVVAASRNRLQPMVPREEVRVRAQSEI
ncbi:MAG: peptidase S8 and S53, subtilisin, kexin, sedolisin [Rhizobiales bacterium]|nr:peptidase S8 and S53, subtilisin, kexin, sedolisin [Hyphomicrobiales bacterium]